MARFHIRAEERANERRSPVTPDGVAELLLSGHDVTVEESAARCFATADFARRGAVIARQGRWRDASPGTVVVGLKELPRDGTPLGHIHVMFGHAFKGQPDGPALLARFRAGGGRLLDLEYLTDAAGRRQAAFGYWAGFAGAGVGLLAFAAQRDGKPCPPVAAFDSAETMVTETRTRLGPTTRPRGIVIGALGRVGSGVREMCARAGVGTTNWDLAETATGGPFPEVLEHEIFFNCILAAPGCPQFIPPDAARRPRALRVIADIACDPGSDYNPVPVYDRATTWEAPITRVAEDPPLDIMAIDNLPSLLPVESSIDFAGQLLPLLIGFDTDADGVWARAAETFDAHAGRH